MSEFQRGEVVEWNNERGFGFVKSGDQRLFFHINNFTRMYRRPEIGDRLDFRLSKDKRGRECAIDLEHTRDGGRLTAGDVGILALLLLLPITASLNLGADFSAAVTYAMFISLGTFGAYLYDKQKAREGNWRTKEKTLHFLALLGGWPGAFVAQRWIRHKTSKRHFQVTFWLIVVIWQVLALDSINNWKLAHDGFVSAVDFILDTLRS